MQNPVGSMKTQERIFMYTTQIIWKKAKSIQDYLIKQELPGKKNNTCYENLPYNSQVLQACSSTNKFLKPIFVSDWLIFYCRILILYQKK